eukprot:1161984-Pelagomonas_calceolata.AAC.1
MERGCSALAQNVLFSLIDVGDKPHVLDLIVEYLYIIFRNIGDANRLIPEIRTCCHALAYDNHKLPNKGKEYFSQAVPAHRPVTVPRHPHANPEAQVQKGKACYTKLERHIIRNLSRFRLGPGPVAKRVNLKRSLVASSHWTYLLKQAWGNKKRITR